MSKNEKKSHSIFLSKMLAALHLGLVPSTSHTQRK